MNTQINPEKKPSRKKYLIPAVIILCILAGYIYKVVTWESKPNPASEAIIRQAAATQNIRDPNNGTLISIWSGQRTTTPDKPIDPNTLTDADFAKITEIGISDKELTDIKLLEKFTNLQNLALCKIIFPEKEIPSWMKMLSKLGIFNLSERFNIDLSPLKKLSNLQNLNLSYTQVFNLEPLRNLTYLHTLNLEGTQVSNLETLRNLTNLQILNLQGTHVSNLEPLRNLTNLHTLWIGYCPNLTDEQVEELQKALPNLEISR